MKKGYKLSIILTAGATILLLAVFSLAPSQEDKITWGGEYPPPPKELTWKEKWERSKLHPIKQDLLNRLEHCKYHSYLLRLYEDEYTKKMREPIIRFDKDPYSKLRRLNYYESYDQPHKYWETYVLSDGLDTHGETLEDLIQKYAKHKLVTHEVDTFRFGCSINEGYGNQEVNYMLSKIHYAEVHTYVWHVEPNLRRTILFLNDNGVLRSFWGYQVEQDGCLNDYPELLYGIYLDEDEEDYLLSPYFVK